MNEPATVKANPAYPDSILITGVKRMAALLGVSPGKLKTEYLPRRDFPARKEESGVWVTTRQSLTAWAESYVNSPDRPMHQRPL